MTAKIPEKNFLSLRSLRNAEGFIFCLKVKWSFLRPLRLYALFFLLVCVWLFAACVQNTERNPNVIVWGSTGDARRLNPIIANDSASGDINGFVFNGLVKFDKDLKLIGDLAERWHVSHDGKEITFYLRRGVKWHDGVEFTADDCLFTYNKLRDPSVETPYSGSYMDVLKAEVVSKYIFRVTYKEPFSPALESWGMGMLPKHLLDGKDINKDPFNRHPIGTGPYKFREWVSGQKITLEAYDDYFEGRPNIDRVIYRIVPDSATMFQELLSGGVDFIERLTPLQYLRKSDTRRIKENYKKFRYPSNQYTFLGYNLLNPLFSDKKVRQALAYAIDRQAIIDGILLGIGKPCTGPIAPVSWAYNPHVTQYNYDPERARRILGELGWKARGKDGILEKDGKIFRFTILTNQGNSGRIQSGEIIQQNLKAIGIEVNVRVMEWQAFLEQVDRKRSFDAIILGWNMGYDPDGYNIWHSSKSKIGEYNFVSYKNMEVDQLLIEGRRTFDMMKRRKIYSRIQEIIAEEQPYAFLYVPDWTPIVHKRFKGIEVAPLGIRYNFNHWYVPKNRLEW